MTRLATFVALLTLVAASLAGVAGAKDKNAPVHHDLVIVKVVDQASTNLSR
jgi:hypothetical protein